MMKNESLYERLGGEVAVDIYYRKCLGDECIRHFFEYVVMARQAA